MNIRLNTCWNCRFFIWCCP